VTGKLLSARLVFCLIDRVLPAIDFNSQLCCRASKIHNAGTNRMLPPKPVLELKLTQCPP
jgi:hypothetical protein